MAKRVMLTTIVTVLVGLFFSFLAAMSLHHSESLSIKNEVAKDVENAALSLERELSANIELLQIMRRQFERSQTVSQPLFEQIAKDTLSRHPEYLFIDWVYPKPNRAANEDSESVKRELSVRYALPKLKAEAFRGESVDQQDNLFGILKLSALKAVPMALSSMPIQQEFRDTRGLFVTMPVYRGVAETDNERWQLLEGIISANMLIDDVFKIAISNTVGQAINLELLELGPDKSWTVIHQNLAALYEQGVQDMSFSSSPIKFAGLEWKIKGTPTKGYISDRRSLYPQIIFIVGMVIFIMLSYILYILQFRAMSIQRHVDQKTRALREANLKLEQISRSDSLTGHYNRRYFDECLTSEVGRSQRDSIPISMMVIEIDHLSDYNETCGRIAGDKAIRLISHEMKEVLCRPSDLFARYGGQQFAVLLPNTNDGEPVAGRIAKTVKALGFYFDNEKGNLGLSISIGGVTVIDPKELSASKLSAYAEIALNKAIAGGRDRVHWINEPERN
ncbi:diguanylate cyclase domain-containing protein [Veronia pacifica]|uniref:diguanylate cyclase n=1 Tax=Veronia pacifica TaxID=1080227 RepID=A0A1C3EPQ6_9GAMM|nr:diguanylate cyclase [Veronia pacifica]ODA35251.1 hypothetical protein A8L45_04890 [Veronia pacifica]